MKIKNSEGIKNNFIKLFQLIIKFNYHLMIILFSLALLIAAESVESEGEPDQKT